MDKGIYTALSGGIAKQHELELIANNLANANTPGFKKDAGTFNEYLTELRRTDSVDGLQREILHAASADVRPSGDKSFVEMDGVYTDHTQGALEKTSRHLDLALEGNGFLEVLTPAGIRYTRQGNLSISRDGVLVTANGFPVLSKDPRLAGKNAVAETEATVPERRRIVLGQGAVHITPEGFVLQNGAQISSLSIVEFHESQWLEKAGNSYFRNTHPDNLKADAPKTQVRQGFLENSNVNPVKEMTRLIEATRAYESHMQAIKTYQDIDGRSVNDIARYR